MKLRSALLLSLAAAQLFLFATLEGSNPAAAGNAFLYYANYLMQAIAGSGPLMFLTAAVALALAARGADLSVAATAALLACLMSRFPSGVIFWWTALPAALAVALAIGTLNGALVARFRWPALIVTLGTMIVYRAAAYAAGAAEPAPFLMVPGYESLGYFEATATMMALIYVALGLGLRRTAWGRARRPARFRSHDTTPPPEAASPGSRSTVVVFALAGLLALPAALVHTARTGGAEPLSMLGVEAQALVAALIAGLGWRTGRLSLTACALAAINLALLAQGMQSVRVALDGAVPFNPGYAFYILLAPITLAALWLNRSRIPAPAAQQATDPAAAD